jgi:hypothetical protein
MYFSRLNSKSSPDFKSPFAIVPATGGVSGFMVEEGHCFSTFSYETGSMIPIQGLKKVFPFEKNQKFYIDFTITANLQVEKAEIKCSITGPEATIDDKSNPTEWSSYPSMFYIQPSDEFDENGRVKFLAEGKRQIKCYVLIGYRQDDEQKNGSSSPPVPEGLENSSNVVQILSDDIILLASMFSGVPVIFPSPYFNATPHVKAVRGEIIL